MSYIVKIKSEPEGDFTFEDDATFSFEEGIFYVFDTYKYLLFSTQIGNLDYLYKLEEQNGD